MTDPRSPHNKNIGKEVDRFVDTYHAFRDDHDENDDADVDFDLFFTDFNKNEDETDSKQVPWLPSNDVQQEESEPEHLSQQLGQLTTFNVPPSLTPTTVRAATVFKRPALTPTTPPTLIGGATSTTTTKKKFRPDEFVGDQTATSMIQTEQLPEYLSRENNTFEQFIVPFLPDGINNDNNTMWIETLRELAYFEHELHVLELEVTLWTTYRRSGTGDLMEKDTRSMLQQLQDPLPRAPCIWPKRLKAVIVADPNVSAQDKVTLAHQTCLNYVNRMLAQFQDEIHEYQAAIQRRRQRLQDVLTPQIEESIANLVKEQGTALDSIVTEGYIAAVKYSYKERLVDLEFENEDRMREYVDDYHALTKSRMAAETAKVDMEILKQRVAHQHCSPLFDSFQLPAPPPALATIQDASTRQRLIYRHEQLFQHMKSEMMLIHIRIAEAKREEAAKQFEDDRRRFTDKLHASFSSATFKNTLGKILERRFQLVDERLQTLLELKVRFFVKAPTVNKQ